MTAPVLRRPSADESPAIAGLIAEAFAPLPVSGWLVPDPAARRAVLAGNFEIMVEYALTFGLVYVTTDRSAVAVWFPRDGEPPPPPVDYDVRVERVCGEWTDRFLHLDDLFDANHPHEAHHHLAFLAVAPDRQGTGTGSALLRHHHARLDAKGMPAYLEASSTRSRDLYLRHGYEVGPPFRVPDGTPFWPMWRRPQQPPAR
ncbi:GNAT family N-acetyltransferase [Polymorphospora rubra]|uniref:N-acetyltransferase n=1 Tax=Polymorphospora rubra TaxID=338584 RepID=A0A810N2R6_9ACTN|nr:N-acetyltransferase [Polymorphospora rubra]